MNINKLLSRLDESVIQEILGREVISTLRALDQKYVYADSLLHILCNTYSEAEILLNYTSRTALIMAMTPIEAIELRVQLNLIPSGDIYDQLNSVSYKGIMQQKLFNFFETEFVIQETSEFISVLEINAGYPLYEYQRNILMKLHSFLESEHPKALLHMPTGSGKTRTTISFICRFLVEHPGKNVVWFANTRELLDQAYDEFNKAWQHLGDRSISAIKFWDKSNVDLSTITDAFVVAGLDKSYEALMKNVASLSKFARNCGLVVMDEAHMAIAPTYRLLIDNMTSNNAALIGLSATPGRTWNDPEEDARLAKFFHKQKAILEIPGYNNPVDYLTEKGYLAKVVNTRLFHKTGTALSATDLRYLAEHYVLPMHILRAVSQDRLRNMAIISRVESLVKIHQRIILFAITKDHAIVMNSLLIALGIQSKVVTSETNLSERAKTIAQFKIPRKEQPTPMVLCNYGILTTGFDAPETSCAVIARPTDSLVLYSQMVGRAIRGKLSGGNDIAEIVTVVDETLPGFNQVADAFINWEDVWK